VGIGDWWLGFFKKMNKVILNLFANFQKNWTTNKKVSSEVSLRETIPFINLKFSSTTVLEKCSWIWDGDWRLVIGILQEDEWGYFESLCKFLKKLNYKQKSFFRGLNFLWNYKKIHFNDNFLNRGFEMGIGDWWLGFCKKMNEVILNLFANFQKNWTTNKKVSSEVSLRETIPFINFKILQFTHTGEMLILRKLLEGIPQFQQCWFLWPFHRRISLFIHINNLYGFTKGFQILNLFWINYLF